MNAHPLEMPRAYRAGFSACFIPVAKIGTGLWYVFNLLKTFKNCPCRDNQTNKKKSVLNLRLLVASYKNIIKDATFMMLFANVSNLYFE